MAPRNWDRIAAGTGVAFVMLFIVALLVVGEGPGVDDPAGEIAEYYDEKEGRISVGLFLFGVVAVLFAWFVAALSTALRAAEQARLAATAFAGGVVTLAAFIIQLTVNGALLIAVREGANGAAVQTMYEMGWAGEVVISFPAAILVGATGIAALRARIFGAWYGWASIFAGLLLLQAGSTWQEDGFWAPDGGYSFLTLLLFLAWTLVTSVLLILRAPVAPLSRATATG